MVKKIRKNFRYPPESANAPKIGERIPTQIAVIEIALAHKKVPLVSFGAI